MKIWLVNFKFMVVEHFVISVLSNEKVSFPMKIQITTFPQASLYAQKAEKPAGYSAAVPNVICTRSPSPVGRSATPAPGVRVWAWFHPTPRFRSDPRSLVPPPVRSPVRSPVPEAPSDSVATHPGTSISQTSFEPMSPLPWYTPNDRTGKRCWLLYLSIFRYKKNTQASCKQNSEPLHAVPHRRSSFRRRSGIRRLLSHLPFISGAHLLYGLIALPLAGGPFASALEGAGEAEGRASEESSVGSCGSVSTLGGWGEESSAPEEAGWERGRGEADLPSLVGFQ